MSIEYRTVRSGDMERISALMSRSMPRDVVSARRLARYTVLEPNFEADALVIAEHPTDGVIGFAYGTCGVHGIPAMPSNGFLTAACVDPRHRRQGIGTEMLHRVQKNLAQRGATSVTVGGYPQAYFWPGVDAEEYPGAVAFLESHGFTRGGNAAAMHLDLDAWSISDSVRDLVSTRESEGYTFGPATVEDLPEAVEFAATRLAPDWGEVMRVAALQDPGAVRRVLLARDPQGEVVGFATYGAYGDAIERFGPFGVDETRRGTGLGRILLNLTLRQMRADAAHGAWFLWTGEQTPAGRLYLSTGFEVSRRFAVMKADLKDTDTATTPMREEDR